MKPGAWILAVLMFGGVTWNIVGMDRSGDTPWPTITDPVELRREAGVLCRREGGWRELPPLEYPPAMTRLHPASVSVSGERVYIGLVPGVGGPRFHGYYVWPDTIAHAAGGIVREESDAIGRATK